MKKIITGILFGFLFLQISFVQASTSNQSLEVDTSIKNSLNSLRAQAEIFYDKSNSYKDLCKDSFIKEILLSVKRESGKNLKCISKQDNYAISSSLKSDRTAQFCVDSTGFSGSGTAISKNKITICEQKPSISNSDVTKKDHFIGGDIKSKVQVVTYSSLEDPFSRKFDKTIRELSQTYGDQVAFVFRHNPLDLLFNNANLAANAAECISKVGNENYFSDYVYAIFKAQDKIENFQINRNTLTSLAQNFGVDENKFDSCLINLKYNNKVKSDYKKIEGTEISSGVPYSVVFGSKNTKEIIVGAQTYEEVKRIIDNMLVK